MTKKTEPVQDAVRAYLELAFGLTEASKKKAEKTVKKAAAELLGKGGATAGQLQTLAEDLVATGLANREAVTRLVRAELDRALGRVGLATADEVGTLTSRIEDLERQLRDARSGTTAAAEVAPIVRTVAETAPVAEPSAANPAAKKVAAKKVVAKKTAPKAEQGRPAADSVVVDDVPAAVRKAPAKKITAKKAPATKAAR